MNIWWPVWLFMQVYSICRHKWFVMVAGLRLHVDPVQLFFHDMSKFGVNELPAYARHFQGDGLYPGVFAYPPEKVYSRGY